MNVTQLLINAGVTDGMLMQKLENFTDSLLERYNSLHKDALQKHEGILDEDIHRNIFDDFLCQPPKSRETIQGFHLIKSVDEIYNGNKTMTSLMIEIDRVIKDTVRPKAGTHDAPSDAKSITASLVNYEISEKVSERMTSIFDSWAVRYCPATHTSHILV